MEFFMRFEVYTKDHNIKVLSYSELEEFLKENGITEGICTDMDKITDVFDSNGEFFCSYERIFNYFIVKKTSWYADSWEEYEHDEVGCEREIKYIKTDYNMGNLIYKYFPSDVTVSPFENSRVEVKVIKPDSNLVYEHHYFRETEVYRHLNYTPKNHMDLVEKFTLEVTKREYDGSIDWEYMGKI